MFGRYTIFPRCFTAVFTTGKRKYRVADISWKRTNYNYKRTSLPRLVPVAPSGGYNIITIDALISARRHAMQHGHAQSLRCKWRRSRRVCLVVRDEI